MGVKIRKPIAKSARRKLLIETAKKEMKKGYGETGKRLEKEMRKRKNSHLINILKKIQNYRSSRTLKEASVYNKLMLENPHNDPLYKAIIESREFAKNAHPYRPLLARIEGRDLTKKEYFGLAKKFGVKIKDEM
ncbi:MAG: hypothetical protein WC602_00890 [archaeon]